VGLWSEVPVSKPPHYNQKSIAFPLRKRRHIGPKSCETVDMFCLTGSAQQAKQSTHLAEGLNPVKLNLHGNVLLDKETCRTFTDFTMADRLWI